MRRDNKSVKRVLWHITAWLLFILHETSLLVITDRENTIGIYFAYLVLNIALFYFHSHFLLDKLSKIGKAGIIVAIPMVCIEIAAFTMLSLLLYTYFIAGSSEFEHTAGQVAYAAWRILYFVLLSTGYWVTVRYFLKQRQVYALSLQQSEAENRENTIKATLIFQENALLQAQVKPHFLFNTLNFIYSSYQGISEPASKGILYLSEIMRYSIKKPGKDGKVLLQEEMEQIQNLVALSRLKQVLNIGFIIDTSQCASSLRIPPLILLTLVENVFKHGNLGPGSNKALVRLFCKDRTIFLYTVNDMNEDFASAEGLGLNNVKTRLQHFYTYGDYHFDFRRHKCLFEVNLQINL